jgi:hypothetical protein
LVQLWLSIANSSRNTASCASLSSTGSGERMFENVR